MRDRVKKNKYGAKKVTFNGITFDSKAEYLYYLFLLDEKKNKRIIDFELQPKFLLQKGFKKNNEVHRAIHYIADFKVFNLDGSVSIVDVKGVETEVFKLKKKLFEFQYPDLSLTIVKGAADYGRANERGTTAKERNRQTKSNRVPVRERKQRVEKEKR